MVGSNFIAYDRRSTTPATLQFSLQKSTDKGEADGAPVLCTVFNTFGRMVTGTHELTLTFDIQTRGGNRLTRTFDVTHLFETEACKQHRWLLLEEVITVEPESGGSGFDPAVDDWDDENHDLDI